MRDILASLPGAANSKELHQCIQLFTATALDQVGMALIEGYFEDNGDVDGEESDSVGGHITTPLPSDQVHTFL